MPRPPKATLALMVIHAVVWLVAQPFGDNYPRWLALIPDAVANAEVWRLVTYPMVQTLRDMLLTLLGLYFFAAPVERASGPRSMLRLWGSAVLLVGVVFALLGQFIPVGVLMGSAAGSLVLLAAFAGRNPNAQILAYMVLPIKAVHMLVGVVILDVLELWQAQRLVWPIVVPLLAVPLGWAWGSGGGFAALNPVFRFQQWRMRKRMRHLGVIDGGRSGGPGSYLQ
jgi:membrane associated rhomboid family serine protease